MVLDEFESAEHALELSGPVAGALDRGATVVLGFSARLGGNLATFVNRMLPDGQFEGRNITTGYPVCEAHPAFRAFYESYGGYCSTEFTATPEGSTALAQMQRKDALATGGFTVGRGTGRLFLVPFYASDPRRSAGLIVDALTDAIGAFQSDDLGAVPPFLADLRLAGEQSALDELDGARARVRELEEQADNLAQFRHLLGTAQGDELEQLVLAALARVLEGTAWSVGDRDDVGKEDFWIINPHGEDYALAEVKAVSGNIRRPNVAQVDQHRSDLDKTPEELPGLLVLNIYRNDQSTDRRTNDGPSVDVARQLEQQNVLYLRTADLYQLLSRKLAGEDAGTIFTDALSAGGGWLEVTSDAHELRKRTG